MSHAQDFANAVGGTLAHVTASSNLAHIQREGLRCAHDLAESRGIDPKRVLLRSDRLQLGTALLNHQLPFLHGIRAASRVLDCHTPESWAEQLDKRIFFWPARHRGNFEASIATDVTTEVIFLDAFLFAETFENQIDLCALNSGSFRQISATGSSTNGMRGDWIYRPLHEGILAFRTYRQRRGLVKSRDSIKEVSLRCAIPPDVLERIRTAP